MINSKHAKTAIPQILSAAHSPSNQFVELSVVWATLSEPTAAAALDQFYSAANLLDEMLGQMFAEQYGREVEKFDYCPLIDRPSFSEVGLRMRALTDHLAKIGASPNRYGRFTRPWLWGLCQRSAYLVAAVDWLVGEGCPDDTEVEDSFIGAMAGTADFGHRLSPIGLEHGTLGLLDTVNMSINKAVAVVTMLSNSFATDGDEGRPSDDSVYYALQSVQHELLDVAAVIESFHRATPR